MSKIQLSEHFTYKKLLRFTIPTVIMLIFTSIYGVIDGIFVSNFAGKSAFAATNLIWPFVMIFGTLGFMFGTGGSAVVAKALGGGETEKAKKYFSLIVYVSIFAGFILTVTGLIFLRPVAAMLGASGETLECCVKYGRILMLGLIPFTLQNVFQSFLITAERPKLGLFLTIAAGVTNAVLDYLFIAVFQWDVVGAAAATCVGQVVGGLIPLVWFIAPNKSPLRLTKTKFEGKILLKVCSNGSSEMVSSLSTSLVSMLYNYQLMKLIGEDGVAAYGVIMYINFIFIGVFMGYAIGSAPVVSYHYGADNHGELKNLFRKSIILNVVWSIVLTFLAIVSAVPLSAIFVGYDAELLRFTSHGFCLYALSYLFMGFNIFGSAFFTALNNGVISAVISFLRILLFQIAAIFILPLFLGTDGIWLAIGAAELLSLGITSAFFVVNRKKYHYI